MSWRWGLVFGTEGESERSERGERDKGRPGSEKGREIKVDRGVRKG